MSNSKEVSISRCRGIKWLLFLLCRFPAYTREFIREHIDKPDTELAELEDYKANCVTTGRCRSILLVGAYFGWIVKNAYIVWHWLPTLDYDKYADKIQEVPLNQEQLKWLNYSTKDATFRHISCLITNCTRLSPSGFDYEHRNLKESSERIVEDVIRLPLVSLCDPWLGHTLYSPMMTLDAIGIFSYSMTMYAHLLLGSWTTIQQMFRPAKSDLILFVTSPKVTTEIKRLRLRELRIDLLRSYQNFQLPIPLLWKRCQKPVPAPQLIGMNFEDEEKAVSNCMPSARTEWWRERLSRLFVNTLMWDVSALLQFLCFVAGFYIMQLKKRAKLYRIFEYEMNAMQCNIWLDHAGALGSNEAVRPGEIDLDWTALSVLDKAGLTLLSGFTVSLMMNFYWCSVQDLGVWLAELRMLMVASLVATRFQHDREWFEAKLEIQIDHIKSSKSCFHTDLNGLDHFTQCGCPTDSEDKKHPSAHVGRDLFIDTHHFYKIPKLRNEFQKSIILKSAWLFERIERIDKWQHDTTSGGLGSFSQPDTQKKSRFSWHYISSRSKDRHYVEKFLAQIIFPLSEDHKQTGLPAEHFDKTDYDLDTMEQIYVNFRLFCEHVAGQPIDLTISITYLLNYGLVVICVMLRCLFPSLELETTFTMVFTSIASNFLIILAADFNAQAKKLQPLIWSLIAQLTLSKNSRAQHMRSLWLKLAMSLDREGGLAMRAFGMSVSYIFIIQLMIWTTTILSIAFKTQTSEL